MQDLQDLSRAPRFAEGPSLDDDLVTNIALHFRLLSLPRTADAVAPKLAQLLSQDHGDIGCIVGPRDSEAD
jgi:hypothetical protein